MEDEVVFIFSRSVDSREKSLRRMRSYLREYLTEERMNPGIVGPFILLVTEIAKNIWDHTSGGSIAFSIQDANIDFVTKSDFGNVFLAKAALEPGKNFGFGLFAIKEVGIFLEMKIDVIDGFNYHGSLSFSNKA